jgi:hypothetical protein
LCKLAPQELIDQARDFRFVAEELIELGSFENERPHLALGDHRRSGRLFRQERDLSDEIASFQMRHLAACDRHSDAASANEVDLLERFILNGQRRAIGEIAKRAGGQQTRNLCIVEADKDAAQRRRVRPSRTTRTRSPAAPANIRAPAAAAPTYTRI